MISGHQPEGILRTAADIISCSGKPSEYLERICKFSNAAAGSIWSNQGTTFSRAIFILRGVYNRPAIQSKVNRLNLDIRHSNVVGGDAIRKHQIIRGKFGCKPFDAEWQAKTYTADLAQLGLSEVAIVPIFDSHDNATGWISLYFSSADGIASETLKSVSILMNSIAEAILRERNIQRLERRKAKHEIMTHTAVIQRKLTEIRSALPADLGTLGAPIPRKFDDLIRSIKVLRNSYDRENFRERIRDRKDQADNLSKVQIRSFLANVATAVRKEDNPRRIEHGTILGPDFAVSFNLEDLTMLFSNLYVNAFKYAKGKLVRTELSCAAHEGIVSIKNDVHGDHRENLDEIWHYEIRGEAALQSEIPGEGIGLGLVKDICDIYDLDVNAYYRDEHQPKMTLFCVELKFPRPVFVAGA